MDLYDYDPELYPSEFRELKLPSVDHNKYLWYLKQNEKYNMVRPKDKSVNCLGYLIDPLCNY